jgi:hypothetical protein
VNVRKQSAQTETGMAIESVMGSSVECRPADHLAVHHGEPLGFHAAYRYPARLSDHHDLRHGSEAETESDLHRDQTLHVPVKDQSPCLDRPDVHRAKNHRLGHLLVHPVLDRAARIVRVVAEPLLPLSPLRSVPPTVSMNPPCCWVSSGHYLLLYQLQFLGLQELLRHARRTTLGAKEELP